MKDGLMVLDILAHHPSTAKFVATKLARHFVSEHSAARLGRSRGGCVHQEQRRHPGSIASNFLSPEFNSAEAYRAKISGPLNSLSVPSELLAVKPLAVHNRISGSRAWVSRSTAFRRKMVVRTLLKAGCRRGRCWNVSTLG